MHTLNITNNVAQQKFQKQKKKKKPECSSVEYHLSQKHSPLRHSVPPEFQDVNIQIIFRLIVAFSIKFCISRSQC